MITKTSFLLPLCEMPKAGEKGRKRKRHKNTVRYIYASGFTRKVYTRINPEVVILLVYRINPVINC
jgi:hypothetical protein